MSLPAGTQIGKYVIQRKLAEGGMAEIFLASSFGPEGFEKQVIIKRIRPAFADDAAFVEMFVSEARLVSRLNHANIVQIFDFDRHDDTFYIAMEYIRGKSLAQAHQRARELSIPLLPALAAQIVAEVARGLSFAHRLTERGQALGLVHRDVTPQNVLLSYEGAVKLTDFGIAKAGTRASTVGMLKGKFAYMSPEQSRGEPVDSRTDIFALGITLWELLTGGRLFDGESDIAVLRAVQERVILPPEQLNPAVSERLSAIVMRCLERERTARFQTALELERALSRTLNTTENSEDSDVGAWMSELFPIEAARTENTEYQRVPTPGRLDVATAATPGVGGATPLEAGKHSMPADLLSGGGPRTQSLGKGPAARSAGRESSGYTPVTAPSELGTDTRRTRHSTALSKPMLLVGAAAIGSTLVAVVLAILLNRKPEADRPPPQPPDNPAARVVTPQPREPLPLPDLSPLVPSPESRPTDAVVAPKPTVLPGPKKPLALSHHVTRGPVAPPAAVAATAPVAAPGKLVLTVDPWGEVLIDGKSFGEQVGRVEYALPPGDHQVEVRGRTSWGPKQISVQSQQTSSQAVLLK